MAGEDIRVRGVRRVDHRIGDVEVRTRIEVIAVDAADIREDIGPGEAGKLRIVEVEVVAAVRADDDVEGGQFACVEVVLIDFECVADKRVEAQSSIELCHGNPRKKRTLAKPSTGGCCRPQPRTERAARALPGQGVERHRAGVRDVEALDRAVHVEADEMVAAVAGELAQALALGPQHDGDGRRAVDRRRCLPAPRCPGRAMRKP